MKIIPTVVTLFCAMMARYAQADDNSIASEITSTTVVEQAADVKDEAGALRGHRELWREEQNIVCCNRSNRNAFIRYIKSNDKISGGLKLHGEGDYKCVKMKCGEGITGWKPKTWTSVHDQGKKYAVCRATPNADGSDRFWIEYTNKKP